MNDIQITKKPFLKIRLSAFNPRYLTNLIEINFNNWEEATSSIFFSPKNLPIFEERIINLIKKLLKFSIVFIPTEKKQITVNRSPHIYSRSKDSFVRKIHKRILFIYINPSILENLNHLAKESRTEEAIKTFLFKTLPFVLSADIQRICIDKFVCCEFVIDREEKKRIYALELKKQKESEENFLKKKQ